MVSGGGGKARVCGLRCEAPSQPVVVWGGSVGDRDDD